MPSCTLSLVPNEPPPRLVGEGRIWTATATNCGDNAVYQFSVQSPGGPLRVARDFSPNNNFDWTPMQEGTYAIEAIAKQGYQGKDPVSAVVSDTVNSRVTGSHAVITPTDNPLVVLYSAPPCSEGTIHVEFSEAGHHPDWRSTNTLPCVSGLSRNIVVAGMLPNTTYQMRHVVNGHDHHHSSGLLVTTGSLPGNLSFPTFTVVQPPGHHSDRDQDMIFQQFTRGASNVPNPLATDLRGDVEWYYDVSQSGLISTFPGQSLVPGGTVLLLGVDRYAPRAAVLDVLREIDLAGDPVRETNIDAVNAQLTAMGHETIYSFTHDVERLPNGASAVIGNWERIVNINGTPTNYIGATILVLDEDFQVAFAWDAIDHLDVKRGPVLGEVCHDGDTDQTCSSAPNLPAVDWLHANAISWSPADGNLVLSMRYQDWVIKIDYENGSGDGHIVWRLGQNGDFTVNSSDQSPWFSHQHNAHFIDDTTMVVFDNGNTRRAGDPDADSRGQMWTLDEKTRTATLVFNADLGNYSDALGAAQLLANGNYCFTSGRQVEPPNTFGQSIEVRPNGTKAYVLQVDKALYRSFRVRTLYEGARDGPGDGSSPATPDAFLPDFWTGLPAVLAATPKQPDSWARPTEGNPKPVSLEVLEEGYSYGLLAVVTEDKRTMAIQRPEHDRAFVELADRVFHDLAVDEL